MQNLQTAANYKHLFTYGQSQVTETRSTMVAVMNESFRIKKYDNFEVLYWHFLCSDLLSEVCL